MTAHRDPNRMIRAFIDEGEERLNDQVFDAIRAEIEQRRQRVFIGPWRTPTMSKFLTYGLGAAAVVVVGVFLGYQLLGSPASGETGVGGASASPTATQEPTPDPTPRPTAWTGLQAGPFVINSGAAAVRVTINIASSDWISLTQYDAVIKDDDGLDPPDTVGVALLAWAWPAGTGFNVYGDPCHWATTIPETPATTPDEIAAAFAAQTASEPTAPVDVNVGGYAGKAITLHVPMTYDLPDATRDERFADCDLSQFGFYASTVDTEPSRNAQGAGQIDELWILDVNGAIVIMDATYSPATPAALVDELRALAESATFEAP